MKYANRIKHLVDFGLSEKEKEFLVYAMFTEQDGRPRFRNYSELRRLVPSRIQLLKDYIDTSNGTVRSLVPARKNKVTERVYQLFPLTREIIKRHGRHCIEFTKIAVIVLNQVVRPFTTKWHKLSQEGALDKLKGSSQFRYELAGLQETLRLYTKMLADMASVEDLTDLHGD